MGKRGPQKTPTVKLKNRGSWLAKTRDDEPVYNTVKADLKPPKELTKEGLQLWKKVLPIVIGQGVLTQADEAAFARYCIYWQRWKELIADPLASVCNIAKIESMLLKLECQFGLTPASRPNVKSNKPDDNSIDRAKPNYFKVV